MFVYLEEDCYGHKVFIVTKPTKSTCVTWIIFIISLADQR